MTTTPTITGAYLTGSVNQPSVDETFTFVGERLQPGVARVPDGEPGERANWVFTQAALFHEHPDLERVPGEDGEPGDLVRPREGVDPNAVDFPVLRYADDARESYAAFRRAKDEGRLAADTRLLISIPTPLNTLSSFVAFEHRVALLPAYERATRVTVERIQAELPHDELAIQWDLPTEVATIEGWFDNPFPSDEALLESIARLAAWVQDDVDLTFHLCYGDSKFGASPFMGEPEDPANDPGGRHIHPRDTSTIVAVANGLSRLVDRRIDAIQAATVRTWTRAAHWQPLAFLALEPETELFLGLVHTEDGIDGARQRIALAGRYLPRFGVSTECGLGRHSVEQLHEAADLLGTLTADAAAPAVAA